MRKEFILNIILGIKNLIISFLKNQIFENVSLINKLLVFSSFSLIFMQNNMPKFYVIFGDVIMLLILFVPMIILLVIFVFDFLYIFFRNFDNEKDFTVLFEKIIFYIFVGLLHILLYIFNIKDYNNISIYYTYVFMFFIGIIYLCRYKFYYNIYKNIHKIKNTKYIMILGIILIQLLFINKEFTIEILDDLTKRIQLYIEAGPGPNHLILN